MNYKKIEELYVDFILDLTGPSQQLETDRDTNFKIVKNIIFNVLNKNFPAHNAYILPYGSYPMKSYLKNADIDITIFLQSKEEEKSIVKEIPIDLISNMILLIKEEFEITNKKSSFELFSEIKVINADIRLLKCKIKNISIDISVNNFSGIYKVVLIDYIEKQFKNEFNKKNLFIDNSFSDNKIQIFRRTLILIKSWCSFEGNLMGSNIGLMASYALEILVIYIFNIYYNSIYNEFDGFEKFFEFMDKFDWEKSIISLFGIFSSNDFLKKLVNYNAVNQKTNMNNVINEPFWYLGNKKGKDLKTIDINKEEDDNESENEPLLKLNEIKKLISPINKSMGNIYLRKEGNIINGTNFEKLINILDPLNNHNNLGKSISFHSKMKMKKIISHMNKQLKYIHEIRKKGSPFLYINSLLNLFNITLTTTYIELFKNYMNSPRLIANSKLYKNSKKTNDKKHINISIDEIRKFNSLFINEKITLKPNHIEEEEKDKCIEESEKSIESEDIKIEKNFEDDYEEDEYAEEEEEENYETADESKSKTDKFDDSEGNIKFNLLINNKVIKKLFELNEAKQKIITFNNELLKNSMEYSNGLEKFLKENKLI
jgi:hypothetical protein